MGLKTAKGDIIVFTDSDCVPNNRWLIELVKLIQKGSEQIIAGRVIIVDKNSPHEIEAAKNLQKKYIGECPTMNVAYSRNIFNELGGFDEDFEYGSDVDLSWRAIKNGYKIRFNKNALIYHDLGDIKNNFRRMYVYGKARFRLYKKHSYKWKIFIGNEMLYILYPIYFIFLPITYIFLYYPILLIIPFIKYRNRNPLQLIAMKTMYGLGIMKEMLLP